MKEIDRSKPMRAIHRKTGEAADVSTVDQSKALRIGGMTAYFDRYGNPKDDFCPWRVENVPSASEGIKAGLEDAISHAAGVVEINWDRAIEGYNGSSATLLRRPLTNPIVYSDTLFHVKLEEEYRMVDSAGLCHSTKVGVIRNTPNYTESVIELGKPPISPDTIAAAIAEANKRNAKEAAEKATRIMYGMVDTSDATPVDKALWERMVGLVRGMADEFEVNNSYHTTHLTLPDDTMTHTTLGRYREARAIAELLPTVVDGNLIEARKLCAELYNPQWANKEWPLPENEFLRAMGKALARGRALERGE